MYSKKRGRCCFYWSRARNNLSAKWASNIKMFVKLLPKLFISLKRWGKIIKTFYIKEVNRKEFKDQIIFHNRYQKNESTLMLNRCGGGSFLGFALNSWGLRIEDLLHNVARQTNEEAKNLPHISWPPSIANLSEELYRMVY